MPIESFIINEYFLALLVPSNKYWKLSHIKLECTMKEKPILKHWLLSRDCVILILILSNHGKFNSFFIFTVC